MLGFAALWVLTVVAVLGFSTVQLGPSAANVTAAVLLAYLGTYYWYGFFESRARFRFDEDRIERRAVLGSGELRWDEVADFQVRRTSGDTVVILKTADGRKLWMDFQLLGKNGTELFATMLRRLDPLLQTILARPSTEVVRFRRLYRGVSLPGAIQVGPTELVREGAGAKRIAIGSIREVSVRLVRSLLPTQEYRVSDGQTAISFRSSLESSPLLIRHLRSRVAEDLWKIRPTGSVFTAKMVVVLVIAAMVWSPLNALRRQAYAISIDRALLGETGTARATVLSVSEVAPWARDLRYVFTHRADGQDQEVSGDWVVHARGSRWPAPGDTIEVQYSQERPSLNRPLDTAAFWVLRPLVNVGLMVFSGLAGLCLAMTVLLYDPPEDPFLPWITEGPR